MIDDHDLADALCSGEEADAVHAAHRALDAWEAVTSGRWTLVDYFERDGRRYILAVDNGPGAAMLNRLTARERSVVEHAARGLHNKAIAHELGIAHATVKVLMARAALKLGVHTRCELIARYLELAK